MPWLSVAIMDKFAENVLRISIFLPIKYKDVYFICMDA